MFQQLGKIPYTKVSRLSTGIEELDWIYGGENNNWGLPEGKISLWSGPSGTGKSRSLITLAREITSLGHKLIYFQNEVNLSDFRSWTGESSLSPNFFASESTSLYDQISDIRNSGARVAIIDSVNNIKEFRGGHKSAINEIFEEYRKVTKETGVHIVFICQLDKSDKIKGGSELLFLADIAISLDFYIVDDKPVQHHFIISVGKKHRYGRMGEELFTVWRHTDNGTKCISDNRLYDDTWCFNHNIRSKDTTPIPLGHKETVFTDPISGATFYEPDNKKIGLIKKLLKVK